MHSPSAERSCCFLKFCFNCDKNLVLTASSASVTHSTSQFARHFYHSEREFLAVCHIRINTQDALRLAADRRTLSLLQMSYMKSKMIPRCSGDSMVVKYILTTDTDRYKH